MHGKLDARVPDLATALLAPVCSETGRSLGMLDHGHAQDKRSNPGGFTGHGRTPSLVAGTLAHVFLPSMLHAYVQEVAVEDYRFCCRQVGI